MEQILNLIKDNEQFKKYVQLVRTYDELPYLINIRIKNLTRQILF